MSEHARRRTATLKGRPTTVVGRGFSLAILLCLLLGACSQQRPEGSAIVVGIWYKTNVAVFQPDIHGVRLSPIADFTFLKDVYRQAAGSPVRP